MLQRIKKAMKKGKKKKRKEGRKFVLYTLNMSPVHHRASTEATNCVLIGFIISDFSKNTEIHLHKTKTL